MAKAALLASMAAGGPASADPAPVAPIKLLGPRDGADCDPIQGDDEEVVVCGRRSDERYRLPPVASQTSVVERISRDPNSLRPPACGVVNSDRNCTPLIKITSVRFGYRPPPMIKIDLSKIPDPPPE